MKKLFLTSSFSDVVDIFQEKFGENLEGKTVTFIPTASLVEKMKFYINSAKKAFEKLGIIVDELEISSASKEEILEKLTKNDFIYISGGNTFFLLQELKKSGADKIILDEIEKGKMYIWESAGSIVTAPDIDYISKMDAKNKAPELDSTKWLNLVDFYTVPHLWNFPFQKISKNIVEKYSETLNIKAISNNQAIFVFDEKIETLGK